MKNWRTLILSVALCSTSAFATPQVIDKVVAVVNNNVVLESDVEGLMRSIKLNPQGSGQALPDDATLRHQVLERLILDNIQLSIAKQRGLTISNPDLENAIESIAQQNHMTLTQLQQQLAQEGINYNTYREQIRKEMIINEVRNTEVRNRIVIHPQEVDALVKQIAEQNSAETQLNLSHILIALPDHPSQQAIDSTEKQANSIVDQLRHGADFGKLAITYSTDAQALNGGEMGWNSIQELPSLFESALQHAKKGEIIGPIRSEAGFHILKVNDIRGEQTMAATEVHARHILLQPSPVLSDAQAIAELQQLAKQINDRQMTFEQAAKEYSQDPSNAQKGGDLGWALPSAYDPAFRDALMKLRKGEISAPVRSSYGWHLIQLLDTRQVDRTDEVQKDRAYRLLFNRKLNEEAQTWLQEQRAAAYVKVFDNNNTNDH